MFIYRGQDLRSYSAINVHCVCLIFACNLCNPSGTIRVSLRKERFRVFPIERRNVKCAAGLMLPRQRPRLAFCPDRGNESWVGVDAGSVILNDGGLAYSKRWMWRTEAGMQAEDYAHGR